MNNIKYIVISPVRNEEKYIHYTLESMVRQTILPIEWIIVNDGSTDNTNNIIKKYVCEYQWVKLINRQDRGYSEPGKGVMEAFYSGYDIIKEKEFDYIVKLDGDLTFESIYFQQMFEIFKNNPKLGLASGTCYIKKNNKLYREKHPEFHVRGPSKIYRKKCWDDIGGLDVHLGWDTLDEIKAQFLGWETKSFKNIKIIHHKPTGFNTGTYKWAIKLGESNYYCGYHPLFMIVKIIKRIFNKPFFFGGIYIGYGYFKSLIKKEKQYQDIDLIKYLQKEQLKKIFFRKGLWG